MSSAMTRNALDDSSWKNDTDDIDGWVAWDTSTIEVMEGNRGARTQRELGTPQR